MFEEIEFNPMAAGLGILGGALSIYVMKNMETGIILKLLTFVLTSIVCYFIASFIANKG